MVEIKWDPENTQRSLHISEGGLVISWKKKTRAVWLGSQTTARLKSGFFSWDFEIESLQEAQIGVGLMVDPRDLGHTMGLQIAARYQTDHDQLPKKWIQHRHVSSSR